MRVLGSTDKRRDVKKGDGSNSRHYGYRKQKSVRYVPGDKMPADYLTKRTSGEFLTRAIQNNQLKKLIFYDSELVTDEMIKEAERDIPLEPWTVRRSQINLPWMSTESATNACHCLLTHPVHNTSYAKEVDTIMSSSVTSDDNQ